MAPVFFRLSVSILLCMSAFPGTAGAEPLAGSVSASAPPQIAPVKPLLPDISPAPAAKPAIPAAPAAPAVTPAVPAAAAVSAVPAAPAPPPDPCAAYKLSSPDAYTVCQDRMMKIQRMLDARAQRQAPPPAPAAAPPTEGSAAEVPAEGIPAEAKAAAPKK